MTQLKNIKMSPPANIEDLKKDAANKCSAKNRLAAVEELGKYSCKQSIDILWHLMINDLVWDIQQASFLKLQAFGEDVTLPRKKPGKLIKDIDKKITKLLNSITDPISYIEFCSLFQQRYPEAYDVYQWDKKKGFNHWLENTIKGNPKELAKRCII